MWQVAGGHGLIDPKVAVEEMVKYHNAGFTTLGPFADIYGPAEDFIGAFRHRPARAGWHNVQALTKWVPEPQRVTQQIAQSSVERSLKRMGVSSLDLVQFHWWDYNNPYYIDAMGTCLAYAMNLRSSKM